MTPFEILSYYYFKLCKYLYNLWHPHYQYDNFDGEIRDPARIGVILDKFETIWRRNPNLRFNQLVFNLTNDINDSFYLDDDDFEKILNKTINDKSSEKK